MMLRVASPTGNVALRPLDEPLLERLLAAAVAESDPEEVMPPVDGPPGWTDTRRAAFVAFHRARALAADPVERTWAVLTDGEVAGAVRAEPVDAEGAVELGIWIGRRWRGQGVGRLAMRDLLDELDEDRVVASTTADNAAAQRLLRGLGATLRPDGDEVAAEFPPANGSVER